MLRRILFVGGACLGVALMVSPALGVRNIPKKAGKYQITVVQGVQACTSPNTKAPGLLATAACDPVVPADTTCVFTEKGSGKIAAKAKDDIAVQAKLSGLNDDCNGESLCAVVDVTTSANGCQSSGDCTTIAQTDLPLGVACCTVDKNKCSIKTTVNTALPGALVPGKSSEFIVGRAGLSRTGGGVAFRGGLLLP